MSLCERLDQQLLGNPCIIFMDFYASNLDVQVEIIEIPTLDCTFPGCEYKTPDAMTNEIVAILTIHGCTHAGGTANLMKPDRPIVGTDMRESEWAQLKFEFENYKKDLNIVGKVDKIRSELLACCERSVRSRLFQMKGDSL